MANLKPFIFLIFLISISFVVTSSNASPTLSLSAETSEPSYYIGEPVIAYGVLKLDYSPVQNGLVAFEVQDPNNSSVITLTLQTDTNGAYNVTFEFSHDAPLGAYTIHVASTYENETATNSTIFGLNQFTITVETDKNSYRIGESVYVSGKLILNSLMVQNGLVAFEVQDPENNPILLTTLLTDGNGTYDIAFKLPADSKLGNYTVHVNSMVNGAKTVNSTSFEALPRALSTDINGDGKVGIFDIATVAKAYGSYPTHPRWNPVADLDGDGTVDILDVARVAKDYGKTV